MPLPYRKAPPAAEEGCAAYLEVARPPSGRAVYGALLVIDARGRPLEFVHNSVEIPAGGLWPETRTADMAVALAHSLFDACRREPDILVCRRELGSAEFCRTEIAPSIPFAQASGDGWEWVNDPPTPLMRGHGVADELRRRGFAAEPFERLAGGLREVYGGAPWSEEAGDGPETT